MRAWSGCCKIPLPENCFGEGKQQVDIRDIQAEGARARLRRQHMVVNPYYRARNMPFSTGETLEQWNRKAAAWRQGWECKNVELSECGGAPPER